MTRLLAAFLSAVVLVGALAHAQDHSPVRRARQLEAAGNLEGANQLLSEYVQQHPRDSVVWSELGRVQLEQRLSDDSMKSFASALAIDPHSPSARAGEVKAAIASALADRNAGNNDGALSCLVRARKLVPDSPQLLTDFGILADSMQIYRDADIALTQAHRLSPRDPKILYALARVQLDEQKMPEAEASLRAYLKMKPDDATAHYGLGHLLFMLSRDDEAKIELDRSIALQPRQTASYYELGQIALQMQQNADAKADYLKVLALDPRHGGALTGLGILAFHAKDYPDALDYLGKAVLCAPDYVEAHHYYSLALARVGKSADAARESALAENLREQQSRLRNGYTLLTPDGTHP